MKLKFKPSKRVLTIGAVVALIVIALMVSRGRDDGGGSGEAGVLDDAASQACADFHAGLSRARSTTARLALADRVSANAARTDNDAIADRAAEMGNNANDGNAAWKASADALTAACRNAGWTAT